MKNSNIKEAYKSIATFSLKNREICVNVYPRCSPKFRHQNQIKEYKAMRYKYSVVMLGTFLLCGIVCLVFLSFHIDSHPIQEIQRAKSVGVVVAQMPLYFEANQGQCDAAVKFLSRGEGYTLFLTNHDAVLALHAAHAPIHPTSHPRCNP